jgi:hypothetical protein
MVKSLLVYPFVQEFQAFHHQYIVYMMIMTFQKYFLIVHVTKNRDIFFFQKKTKKILQILV